MGWEGWGAEIQGSVPALGKGLGVSGAWTPGSQLTALLQMWCTWGW